ncbi:hypothetical protein Tco_0186796, partial [Tanacetum coccineum]
QPQPSAAPTPTHPVPRASPVPTPTHHVPTPSSSHVQITQPQSPPPPITATPPTQPPPSLTQPVQSTSTPPIQPVGTSSTPPIFTISDTQPTFPPSPQIPSPSYHLSPPPSHELENQAFRSSEESEQLRNLMDIVPRLQSKVESLEKKLSETKQTLRTAILQLIEKVKKLENKLRMKRKSKEAN